MIAQQNGLTVFIRDKLGLIARAVRRRQRYALDPLAEGIPNRDRHAPIRLVANDDFAVRHRDQRLRVKDIPFRRALLPEIKLRALRQAETRLGFARANAHGFAGQQRIGPRRQLSVAGVDIHAELRPGQGLNRSAVRHAFHAQADRAHAARRAHGGHINIVAKAFFLRDCRSVPFKHRQRAHQCARFDDLIQNNIPPLSGKSSFHPHPLANCGSVNKFIQSIHFNPSGGSCQEKRIALYFQVTKTEAFYE